MTTNEQLLTLLLNSKKGDDLPVITSLSNSGKIIVYDPDTQLVSTILKSNLIVSGGAGSSSKIDVTVDYNGQTSYIITSKPDNVDLVIARVYQHENIDYTYSNQTGLLTIINASVGASIKTDTYFDLRGYQNFFSKKEALTISSSGQSIFNLNDLPNNISLVLNRTILFEGVDYTYENTTGVLTITNPSFISQVTLNSILEARKIY